MKDSLPNMDEVVRQAKTDLEAYGDTRAEDRPMNSIEMLAKMEKMKPFSTNADRYVRLLIEEREQLKHELKHSQGNMKMAISSIEQKDKELEKCHTTGLKLSAKADEQDKQLKSLIAFAKVVVQTALDGNDLDGGQIQELGIEHGLLNEEPYDPDKHGADFDFDPGDRFYVYSDILKIK